MTNWHLVRADRAATTQYVATQLRDHCHDVLYLRSRATMRPLFVTPYLFARWETSDATTWHRVRWTQHVSGIVGGAVPAIVSQAEVDSWRALADEFGVVDLAEREEQLPFPVGSTVEFSHGVYDEKRGIFCAMQGKDAVVEIALLGAPCRLYVPFSLLRLVEVPVGEVGDRQHYSGRAPGQNRRGSHGRNGRWRGKRDSISAPGAVHSLTPQDLSPPHSVL